MSATAAATIAIARHYVGIKENPPGSNRQQFGAWYGMNDVPWCAEFTSFCQYVAGLRWSGATTAKGFSYCPSIIAWGQARGRLSRTPHLGDLALWVTEGVAHHVEITTGWGVSEFSSIGGNTGPANLSNGGEVIEHTHPRSSEWVFVSPYYAAPSVPTAPIARPGVPTSPVHRNIVLTSPLVSGADVKWAQQRLLALHLLNGGVVDGTYGPNTARSVGHFQALNHLVQDNVLGPVTGYHLAIGH